MIWKVSDFFEEATEYLGRNMSEGIRGASLNAIGSSMPELITSFIFLFYLTGSVGYEGTIGTTAGSAVFNSLLIPAAVILIVFSYGIVRDKRKGIELSPVALRRDGFFLLASEMALILVISTNTIMWYDGLILIVIYLIYAGVMYRQNKNATVDYDPGTKEETRKAWLMLGASTLAMTLVCWLLVWSVEQVGVILGIPLIFTSIILASAASSVPDTVISIKDGLKGNYDDAVSNALGSNIFDICISHGLPLFIYIVMFGPIVMTPETTQNSVELRVGLIVVTAIAVLIYVFSRNIFRKHGYMFIALYLIFIAYVVTRAMGYNLLGL
jgi:cation:H+ antiporter